MPRRDANRPRADSRERALPVVPANRLERCRSRGGRGEGEQRQGECRTTQDRRTVAKGLSAELGGTGTCPITGQSSTSRVVPCSRERERWSSAWRTSGRSPGRSRGGSPTAERRSPSRFRASASRRTCGSSRTRCRARWSPSSTCATTRRSTGCSPRWRGLRRQARHPGAFGRLRRGGGSRGPVHGHAARPLLDGDRCLRVFARRVHARGRAAFEAAGGGSVLTMTYLGGERAVPHYNVMGVAKATLDSSVKYLAWDLGSKNVRINAISAGPVRTLAARSIAGFPTMESIVEERSPLHRHVDADESAPRPPTSSRTARRTSPVRRSTSTPGTTRWGCDSRRPSVRAEGVNQVADRASRARPKVANLVPQAARNQVRRRAVRRRAS